ncbi:MAG: hypothetical protein KGI38_02710 [Thaumarchaeota archaeon]|nr:hypothetical protein [Nitrososphaerota archaeon]
MGGKATGGKKPRKAARRYRFEFPKEGVAWYVKKSGSVMASSRAEAKRELVKRGLLEPFEARVATIIPVRA